MRKTRTDKVFEFKFKRFSEQVFRVARWYEGLSAKAKAVVFVIICERQGLQRRSGLPQNERTLK